MSNLQALLPFGRRIVVLDFLLACWVAIWLVLALAISEEVRGLADLSTTVSRVGTAVQESGRALDQLGDLPFGLGDRLNEPAARIEAAGRSAVSSGQSSRDSVESLSILLALAIAVIPSMPVIGFYVPLRLAMIRERGALRRAARDAVEDPHFEEFLARRAIENVAYRRLLEFSREPWRDLAQGRHRGLARAELERLGIRDEMLGGDPTRG